MATKIGFLHFAYKNVADLFEDLAKSAGLNKSSLLTTWINQKGNELEQKK